MSRGCAAALRGRQNRRHSTTAKRASMPRPPGIGATERRGDRASRPDTIHTPAFKRTLRITVYTLKLPVFVKQCNVMSSDLSVDGALIQGAARWGICARGAWSLGPEAQADARLTRSITETG